MKQSNTMKLRDIHEMTMTAGKLNFPVPDFTGASHIGDIEGRHKILYKESEGKELFGIEIDDQIVSFMVTRKKILHDREFLEILIRQTREEFQGKNINAKLLFWIKSQQRIPLLLGDIQSDSAQSALKSLVNSGRFIAKWFNTETGEVEEYYPENDQPDLTPYRSLIKKTQWRIIIESLQNKDEFPIPPFLRIGEHTSYFSFFDNILID